MKKLLDSLVDRVTRVTPSKAADLASAWTALLEEYAQLFQTQDGFAGPHASHSMLPVRLQRLAEFLVEPDEERVDFIVKEQIFQRLCAMGIPDRPEGIRTLITQTLEIAVADFPKLLLHHPSVHKPLLHFIVICHSAGDHAAPSCAPAFLSLIQAVAKRLRKDPAMGELLAFVDEKDELTHSSADALILPLVTLMDDDKDLGAQARSCLRLLLQTSSPDIAERFIVSSFSKKLGYTLSAVFEQCLPKQLDLETVAPIPKFEQAEFWLSFVNDCASFAHIDVADQIAQSVLDQFLFGIIKSRLSDLEESTVRTTMTYLRKVIIPGLWHKSFSKAFTSFFVGIDSKEKEFQMSLMKRINHLSPDIALEALRLYQCVFECVGPPIMELLVQSYVVPNDALTYDSLLFEIPPIKIEDSIRQDYLADCKLQTLQFEAFRKCELGRVKRASVEESLLLALLLEKLDATGENMFNFNLCLTKLLSMLCLLNHPSTTSIIQIVIEASKREFERLQKKLGKLSDTDRRMSAARIFLAKNEKCVLSVFIQ